ncbi:MAG TPA: methyltransferase domain-containing protein [Candidatus Binatia bacterium]|nr:methyltransferase domain-containing protein [Candidatus Binatia bacterium]
MSDAPVARLAALVEELARAHRATAAAPRGLPYLGLEHASGTGFHLLDALAARGIFRKYELVLELGAGLGATSRWLAQRLGCQVVGVTGAAEAEAGRFLTERAGLGSQVRLVPAAFDDLPLRDGRFTHVWAVESLARIEDLAPVLREVHRALRPGGSIALQELVRGPAADALPPGWSPTTLEARIAALAAAGFVDVQTRDRSTEAAERSAQVTALRARLQARLEAERDLAPLAAERRALATALARGTLRLVQIGARRP